MRAEMVKSVNTRNPRVRAIICGTTIDEPGCLTLHTDLVATSTFAFRF